MELRHFTYIGEVQYVNVACQPWTTVVITFADTNWPAKSASLKRSFRVTLRKSPPSGRTKRTGLSRPVWKTIG